MPISFRIYPEQRLSIATWRNSVDDAHMLAAYRDVLYVDDEWQAGYDEIVDVRRTSLTITGDGVRTLSTIVVNAVGDTPFKTAVLVDADLPFGLARMYEAFAEQSPEHVGVFRSVGDAAAFVGCPVALLDGE